MSGLLLQLLPSASARWLVAGALIIAVAGFGFARGVDHERTRWEVAAAAQERDLLLAVQRAAAVSERIVIDYVDRVRTVYKAGETIVREVPVYVTAEADRRCVVPHGFVRVHDAAAHGLPLPGAAGAVDDAPADLALSTVAGTVAANYTDCHAVIAQLTALQAWVRDAAGHE